jgi:serine/threonine protein kinase
MDTKPSGDFDFSNFMKCITQLSYSAMFTSQNSTKFNLRNLDEITKARAQNIIPRFSGIQTASEQTRMQSYTRLASAEILGRKNELGLIIDTIASCLEIDPKKRPTIRGLLNSPLFD